MTRDEIRAEAAERLARAQFEDNHRGEIASLGWSWESVHENMRGTYRRWAARILPAIDDFLPTGEEWGVRAGAEVRAVSGVLHLRVAGAEPTMCKRYVHEWRDGR